MEKDTRIKEDSRWWDLIPYAVFSILFIFFYIRKDIYGMLFCGSYVTWYKIDRIWRK